MLRTYSTIRHRLYRLPRDPLVAEVLNPAFASSTHVLGAFGWFSSAWIATLAHGLAQFLAATNQGKIQIVIAPELFPHDRDLLDKLSTGDQWALDRIAAVIGAASVPDADRLERHAVECLGWMIQHGILDIQVAIPRAGSNYHPKIWLFDDGRDRVLVRGSANATARALGLGIEHMDVDCSWIDDARVSQSVEILNDWLSGNDEQLLAVIPLPQALRESLIKCAPNEMPTVAEYDAACAASKHFGARGVSSTSFSIPANRIWESGKFEHQGEAVRAWEKVNGCGLLEMATGAGKTVTALICAQRLQKRTNRPLLVVISAPTKPLVAQWRDVCAEFGLRVVGRPESDRATAAIEFSNGIAGLKGHAGASAAAFVVTNFRVADEAFQNLIRQKALADGVDVLHIGDEAHTLGAEGFRRSPKDFANYRLGLSATPMRKFDEEGTESLLKYFGEVVFRFGLDRAIGVCLVPYEYFVHAAELAGEELDEFLELSRQIAKKIAAMGGDDADLDDENLTAMFVRRRSIVENASDKLRVFDDIVRSLSDRSLALVYTSSKNPAQLEQAMRCLAGLGIAAAKITEEESSRPGDFKAILEAFKHGAIEMLVAKRVLDEGVDLPPVRQAIMLASSSVEREWIQRRGRILRMFPGKQKSVIHDILSVPPVSAIGYDETVLKFISSELERVRAFAQHAMNPVEASRMIDEIHTNYFLR